MRKNQLISILSLAERIAKSGSKLPLNFSESVEKFKKELDSLESK